MMEFREFFEQTGVVFFGGGIGTQIYAKGISKGHCYDELNISMPEVVMSIHQEYIQALRRSLEGNLPTQRKIKAVAREIIAQLQPLVDGILLMPPLGRFRILEDILS
ncbi:MAG: hypothetical protein ACE5LV_02220 [Candidatus Aminicenantales bacterium]